ncbi:hypothetical protein BH10PLA1_BH10PLA1_13800 [soil metagenome]
MNRVAYILAALGIVALSIRPLLSSARQSPNRIAPDRVVVLPTSGQSGPSDTLHVTQFKKVRGQDGFWRLGQDLNGVWWMLDPTGQPEFINAVTTVQPFQKGRDAEGPEFVSRDYNGQDGQPNLDAWAKATLTRVKEMGFKGLGAWCNPIFHSCDVPMTRDLNVWTWQPSSSKRFYSPNWATVAEQAIKTQVELLKDNKNLIGYFIDNELEWGDGFAGPGVYFDFRPSNDANRAQVISVIKQLWPTADDFNRDWGLQVKSLDELYAWERLPHDPQAAYTHLFNAWIEHLATDYFKTTTTLIHKYDPNHLILGVRFRGYAPPEVVRASKGYTDAQSINYYVGDARLDYDMFKMMYDASGEQPIIISEYSFHALDGRSGDRNTVGFAAQVLDQQARAEGYRLFTSRLARVPYIVSADWFQWMDEPPSGRTLDGEDVNFGMVDIDDRPYESLASAVRETAGELNGLHLDSYSDDGKDVWRESFANKPVVHVPYLTKLVSLNGELSDWAPQCKLQGIHRSQTIGLERSKLPLPNVYLGWTEKGLYVGMEVFDDDILSAPAKGWWWTRDCAEIWINTRTPLPDQITYSKDTHSFFFVPNPFPDNDGSTGVVGQWHRAGDALADSLIPHPLIKSAVRIRPDRYVLEMFIPKEAMYEWDPHQPMAMNIHVKNFQHATEYYWSAPKEAITQLRPNTWGTMILDAPNNSVAISARK